MKSWLIVCVSLFAFSFAEAATPAQPPEMYKGLTNSWVKDSEVNYSVKSGGAVSTTIYRLNEFPMLGHVCVLRVNGDVATQWVEIRSSNAFIVGAHIIQSDRSWLRYDLHTERAIAEKAMIDISGLAPSELRDCMNLAK